MYISTPPSLEVENFQIKNLLPRRDRTPDLLNLRQTCYHLSQRGEQVKNIGGMKMGKQVKSENNSKNPDISQHNYPLAILRLELGAPVGTD